MDARRRQYAILEDTIARHRREVARLTATPEIEGAQWERLLMTRRALARALSRYDELLAADGCGLAVA